MIQKVELTKSKTTILNAENLLKLSAKLWFSTATIGQLFFGIYVFVFYYTAAFAGDFEKWNRVLPTGYVPGDWAGNVSVAVHVLLGGIIILVGPMQFLPIIQKKYKNFHRWLGRIYVVTVVIIGLAGLAIVWVRGSAGDLFMDISISVSAVYLLAFAVLTIINAMNKNFNVHRKMALRLFMIANGGWFFRIGLMGWILYKGGPVGFNLETFSGPALWIISVMSYSLPVSIILLELYFYAQEQKKLVLAIITTSIIILATLLTVFGIFAASINLWYPYISG